MKKLYTLLMALTSLVLVSCDTQKIDVCPGENVLVGNVCFDVTKPEFRGVEHITIELNETFDIMDDVTAIDDMDGDITSKITTTGFVDTTEKGTYFVTYTVSDTYGNEAIALRYVTVEIDYSNYTENLVENGTFEENLGGWTYLNNNSGGTATMSAISGVCTVEIHSIPQDILYWTPRLEYQNLPILNGSTYYVSFDVRADLPRYLHLQVGELLPADPWFIDFRPGVNKIYFVTTEWQTFDFTFTMKEETNFNGAIIFEMGHVRELNLVTTIYFDNIVVKQVGE